MTQYEYLSATLNKICGYPEPAEQSEYRLLWRHQDGNAGTIECCHCGARMIVGGEKKEKLRVKERRCECCGARFTGIEKATA